MCLFSVLLFLSDRVQQYLLHKKRQQHHVKVCDRRGTWWEHQRGGGLTAVVVTGEDRRLVVLPLSAFYQGLFVTFDGDGGTYDFSNVVMATAGLIRFTIPVG